MNKRSKAISERWRDMLIVLRTEGEALAPGRIYFLATGDNRLFASHRGRPGLQAMERRGWVKQHIPGFSDGRPAWAIRPGEDSLYSITEAGVKKLDELGFNERACKAIRKIEWER